MTNRICACLIGLAFLVATPALAAESPAKPSAEAATDAARASFQRGVELFHEGNFEAALAEFRKANETAPSYRILYNIAQTYFETHDYVNALKYYKQYLVDGDADVAAARKAAVEEIIQKLQTRIALVDISVNLDGAQVSVDDVALGTSPLDGPVPLNPGTRRVSATKAGFPAASRSITVAGSDRQSVTLTLREASLSRADVQGSSGAPLLDASSKENPGAASNAALVVSLTATGLCAVTTGIFGWLTIRAKSDFDSDLNTVNISPTQLDDDRSKMRTLALITDIAAGATLVGGVASLYLALTHTSHGKRQSGKPSPFVAIAPTPTGLAVHGGW
jgi:hypothetical protein